MEINEKLLIVVGNVHGDIANNDQLMIKIDLY